MILGDLKKGDWFTLHQIKYPVSTQVFEKGDYDSSLNMYLCFGCEDPGYKLFLKSDTLVFEDFLF